MKTNKNTNDPQLLLRLIDRYFEAETTLEEERTLRRLLAETDYVDEAVEAARAVMGVFAIDRKIAGGEVQKPKLRARRRLGSMQWAAISAVASVAIIIVAVVTMMNVGSMQNQKMLSVASVVGEHDSIAQLMPGERKAMGRQHGTVAMATMNVNNPESPAEIDALIKSEMGLMAEAQSSVYESVVNDFATISSIME